MSQVLAAIEAQARALLAADRPEEAEAVLRPPLASGSGPLVLWRLLVLALRRQGRPREALPSLCYNTVGYDTICLGATGAGVIADTAVQINFVTGMTSNNPTTGTTQFQVGATNASIAPFSANNTFTAAWGVLEGNYGYAAPTTTQTVTFASFNTRYIIDPAGTLASLTVALPQCNAGNNGRVVAFGITQAITSLTVNSVSSTVSNAPSASAAGFVAGYICRSSNTTWYPTQV